MTLVLVTGPPASGKTTLAQPLAHHLSLPLLSKDTHGGGRVPLHRRAPRPPP